MRRSIGCTMLRVTLALLLAAAPSVAAVAAPAGGKQARPGNKDTEVVKQGKILVVRGMSGGEPQITDEKGERWLIEGPAREETLRLGGHTLKVWGVVGSRQKLMTPTLTVSRYEILDSGGRRPLVGILRQVKQGYALERQEDTLQIAARSQSFFRLLSARRDCKIWIVGDLEGTTLTAHKFGWITCKPPKALKQRKESTK